VRRIRRLSALSLTLTPLSLPPSPFSGVTGADQPHANICAQTTGPCPVAAAGPPSIAYVQGERVRVTLQKNLDHFAAATPGNFSIFMWPNATTAIPWGSVPDTAAPTLSLYYIDTVVPATLPTGNYVLQSVYNTNNAGAPGQFYQCADVVVLAAPTADQQAPVDHSKMHQSLRA
jgi:hypothetical protein